jgi:hypothetical protein
VCGDRGLAGECTEHPQHAPAAVQVPDIKPPSPYIYMIAAEFYADAERYEPGGKDERRLMRHLKIKFEHEPSSRISADDALRVRAHFAHVRSSIQALRDRTRSD